MGRERIPVWGLEVTTPKTPSEWQAAVDAAMALLRVGEEAPWAVNAERCREVLDLGHSRGFDPAPDALERLLLALREGRPLAVH